MGGQNVQKIALIVSIIVNTSIVSARAQCKMEQKNQMIEFQEGKDESQAVVESEEVEVEIPEIEENGI